MRNVIFATAFALAFAGAAKAEEPRAPQGQSIDLGDVSGVAYYTYTRESDGFRVVATLGQGGAATPVRFEAVLMPGQSVMLSAPHEAGRPSEAVFLSRVNDTMVVRKAATN